MIREDSITWIETMHQVVQLVIQAVLRYCARGEDKGEWEDEWMTKAAAWTLAEDVWQVKFQKVVISLVDIQRRAVI